MGRRKKYSKAFERDWQFYVACLDLFTFSGKPAPMISVDVAGADAKRCFHRYDSTGRMPACRDPGLLRRVLIAKGSVNLHIKMWAEGLTEGTLTRPELEDFLSSINAPSWVLEATLRNRARLVSERFNQFQSSLSAFDAVAGVPIATIELATPSRPTITMG